MPNTSPITTPQAGRQQARRVLPHLTVCADCEVAPARERHHWDGDPLNNDPRNLFPVCRRCHMRIDGRLEVGLRVLPVGWMADKTHCKRGHEFTPENTYRNGSGDRICRECKRAYEREQYRLGRRH